MTGKQFYIVSAILVFLILIQLGITYTQVYAIPGDIPRYDILFEKIMGEPIDIDPDTGEVLNDGSVIGSTQITNFDWEEIKAARGGKVLDWGDVDITPWDCGNNSVLSRIGTNPVCQDLFGDYVAVEGSNQLPPQCPEGSVLKGGDCKPAEEQIDCSPGYIGQRVGDKLYCYYGYEVKNCPRPYYHKLITAIGARHAACSYIFYKRDKKTGSYVRHEKRTWISCSGGKYIYATLPHFQIRCRAHIVKQCPENYQLIESKSDADSLVCQFH